jgi:F-type H+-transporting ATPase subunit b
MENELLSQLGINWGIFLSQAFNFAILLAVLTFFVYKPLMKVLDERAKRIKEGLDKAAQADARLKEVDEISKERIKTAEQKSVEIIRLTGQKAKILEQDMMQKMEEKQRQIALETEKMAKKQKEDAQKQVLSNAVALVRDLIIKTVELNPKDIDDKLIKKAADEIQG